MMMSMSIASLLQKNTRLAAYQLSTGNFIRGKSTAGADTSTGRTFSSSTRISCVGVGTRTGGTTGIKHQFFSSFPLGVLTTAFREAKLTLLDANNGEAVLTLPHDELKGRLAYDHIFVRDFYDRFIEQQLGNFTYVEKRSQGAVVLGTPGIGKSAFAWYVVWKALNMGKTVLFHHFLSNNEYLLFRGDEPVQVLDKFPEFYFSDEERENMVFVVDTAPPRGYFCYTVLVSSPDYKVVKEFLKTSSVHRYFFPTHTLHELKSMRDSCFGGNSVQGDKLSDEELTRRYFELFGGVPRFALCDVANSDADMLIGEMVSKASEMLRSQSIYFRPEDVYDLSHRVFHLIVSRETFQIEEIAFASKTAARLLDEKDFTRKLTQVQSLLKLAPR